MIFLCSHEGYNGEQEETMQNGKKNKGFWSKIEDYIVERPMKTSLITIGLLLVASYALLWILTLIDQSTTNVLPNVFTRLDGGLDSWFSFYASFIGASASTILGIITYRHTFKIDKMDRCSKIREMTLGEIRLYDLWRDFKPSVVQCSEVSGRFVLEIELNNFQSYYSAEVESVEWGSVQADFTEEQGLELQNLRTYIENGKAHVIHLYFDDFFKMDQFENLEFQKKQQSFHYYFRQNLYCPILMYPYQRQRYLKIHLKLQDPLYKRKSEMMMVEMCIFVENGGYNEKGYIDLVQKKYAVKIC